MTTQEIIEFKNKLREGSVSFSYTKKNGDYRDAIDTLNMEMIPEENHPKGIDMNLSDDIIRYYDLNSNGWRSFHENQFISYDK